MCQKRISAGELEARYNTKHALLDFSDAMKAKIFKHFEDKGTSWKECDKEDLINKLVQNVNEEDWISVANFAFFLSDKENKLK